MAVLIVVLSLPLILYPRFNRQDIGLIQPLVGTPRGDVQIDMKYYLKFTQYFKGQQSLESIAPPFSYRPLVPYLASRLPFNSFLSFNLVNVLAVCLTTLALFFMYRRMGFAFEYGILGSLLSTLSFPVMYYGPSGYVDATAVLVLVLIVMTRVYEKDYLLPFLCFIGGVTKETVIVVFPFLLVDICLGRNKRRSGFVFWIVGLMAYFTAVYWARITFGSGDQFVWMPGGAFLAKNLCRAKTYISFILAFGLPGLFASLYILKHSWKRHARSAIPLMVGMLSGLALFGYSLLSAYADGRFVWTAYPFMVGLSLHYFKTRAES